MTTTAKRKTAKQLRRGDYYCNGRKRVRGQFQRGAWVYVTYAYRVARNDGSTSMYYQNPAPVEKLHVNKHANSGDEFCNVCGRHMSEEERGDVFPEELVCDGCAGL